MKLSSWIVATSLVFGSGCLMRTSTHESAMAKAKKEHDEKVADLDKQIADLTAKRDALQKEIEGQTVLLADLKGRLEKLGQNVDSLTSANAEAEKRLEELRKQKAAADARLATFKNLLSKLQSMIDSKQLKVVIRDGRMIIALPNDILFDSGKTSVKKEGKDALEKVAQVLATVPDRDFLVAGHTDDIPIKTAQFPSNWELSTARAISVVKFLMSQGISSERLSAAGFAEFQPIDARDDEIGWRRNRRIELKLTNR